jgi:hypothetical protein
LDVFNGVNERGFRNGIWSSQDIERRSLNLGHAPVNDEQHGGALTSRSVATGLPTIHERSLIAGWNSGSDYKIRNQTVGIVPPSMM